ncbi:MAG: hypothetical protein ACRELZ_15110 [Candidatus Rokuibacteriota bacterium]
MNRLIANVKSKALAAMAIGGLCVTALATPASAVSFTMSSAELSLRNVDPGLVLYNSLVGGALPWTFTLNNIGDTATRDVFVIGTHESSVTLFEDTKSYPATASFKFSSPPGVSSDATGTSDGRLGWHDDIGLVSWDDSAYVDFGAYGALAISLADVSFGTPGEAVDAVTVRLVRGGAIAVSAPSTLVLLACGIAGILAGKALRSRRSA